MSIYHVILVCSSGCLLLLDLFEQVHWEDAGGLGPSSMGLRTLLLRSPLA